MNCYCSSNKKFINCCEPYIKKIEKPPTAEALMRSRYSAYCIHNADYIIETTHISTRKRYNKNEIMAFATDNHWIKLEVIKAVKNSVEFKAYYLDSHLIARIHHEKSIFIEQEGSWFYMDGIYK
jgi:SEC-C motif domain protein